MACVTRNQLPFAPEWFASRCRSVMARAGTSRHAISTGQVRLGHPASMVSVGFSRIACPGIKTLLRSGPPPQQAALLLDRRGSPTRSRSWLPSRSKASGANGCLCGQFAVKGSSRPTIRWLPVHSAPCFSCADGSRSGAAGRLASNDSISMRKMLDPRLRSLRSSQAQPPANGMTWPVMKSLLSEA